MSPLKETLRRGDYLLLVAFCLGLFCFALGFNRSFSTHETIHCVNVREMIADGDWVIPHFGGRPWLERPPLPFWITVPLITLLGDIHAAYRLAPLLAALPCVLLVGWMASLWFGRGVGLLAGLVFATIREVTHYATAPECDMFLCSVITSALALFVALEFRHRPAEGEGEGEGGFVGKRPWLLLAFFVVLGLTNLVKGLFFGTVLTLVPVACYLLLGERPWSLIRRYIWLPGWLAFAVAASAWALAAYRIYPDIVELWKSDYVGRLNEGYMREPSWYYLLQLPWVLFPWTLAVGVGLVAGWSRIVREGRTPERFLFAWGVGAIAVLSVPQGKHHHYLLHAIAPWAVFAALGTARFWQWLQETSPTRLVWSGLTVAGLGVEVGLVVAARKYSVPGWALATALVACPVVVAWLAWITIQREPRRAAFGVFALLLVGHWVGHALLPILDDRYAGDRAFVAEVQNRVPAGKPLFVLNDYGPLDPSWMIFYLEGRAKLLHNASFLRAGSSAEPEVYVIGRREFAAKLDPYGSSKVVLESARSRDDNYPGQHFCLYRLRIHSGLDRHPDPVYISPMQATGRAPGPVLEPEPVPGRDPLSWRRPGS